MNSQQQQQQASRKRSRWGQLQQQQQQQPTGTPSTTAISDQEALQALLSSAQAREDERSKQAHQKDNYHKKDRSADGDGDDNDSERRRKNRRTQGSERGGPTDTSYYGPSSSSSAGAGAGQQGKSQSERQSRWGSQKSSRSSSTRSRHHRHSDEQDKPSKNDSTSETTTDAVDKMNKQKPNFGLSGALAQDQRGGNVYKGVLLKFQEPPEARAPNTQWRLYVFKDEKPLETLHISKQSAYLIGRHQDVCDIVLQHPSCSSQHAVLQYRAVPVHDTDGGGGSGGHRLQCRPYLLDLESTNGTFLNGVRIDAARYYELKKGDVLKFGASTREYVLLTANTTKL